MTSTPRFPIKRSAGDSFNTIHVVILVLAITASMAAICSFMCLCVARSRKQTRKQQQGCHCYDDLNTCCSPWWAWQEARCTCGRQMTPTPKERPLPPRAARMLQKRSASKKDVRREQAAPPMYDGIQQVAGVHASSTRPHVLQKARKDGVVEEAVS